MAVEVLTSVHVIMIKLLLIQKHKILAFELLCKFKIYKYINMSFRIFFAVFIGWDTSQPVG